MLGDFDTGRLLARDGRTVVKDRNDIAKEWQVREDEPMLFQSIQYPQHPQECVLPTEPTRKKESRRLGESVARAAAAKACAQWREDEKDLCIKDVLATGDLELAQAGSF